MEELRDLSGTPDAVGLFLMAANDDDDALTEVILPLVSQAFGLKGHTSTVEDRARLLLLIAELAKFGGSLLGGIAAAAGKTPDEMAATWLDYRDQHTEKW